MQNRPVCFVGWQGIDPDIPPLLHSSLVGRDPSLPIFWIHFEGLLPEFLSLEKNLQDMPALAQPLAGQNPILTDADRAFGEMLTWLGISLDPNPYTEPLSFDFQRSVGLCTKTGVTRMVGIALRRGGKLDLAQRVLTTASSLAQTGEERSAALEELSLLHQQIGGRKTNVSRKYLASAREALGDHPDPWLQLNADFGLLSQTVVALKNQPWLLLRVPGLFRRYWRDIEFLERTTSDVESAALHKSLYHLYKGRLRFKVLGWLARMITPVAGWIKDPFDTARSMMEGAKDVHVHSRIDVLAYRAVALAHLRLCDAAADDLPEIERLIVVLNDDARTRHWENQKKQIDERCINRGI
jgi:hypothetical protein